MSSIERFRVGGFSYPRDRVIGDASVALDTQNVGVIELVDSDGITGIGFFDSMHMVLPPAEQLAAYVAHEIMPDLAGRPPEGLIHRLVRPRGAAHRKPGFELDIAVDNALWDLAAKRAGMPLFRYLGGTEQGQRIYASGVCFNLSDEDFTSFYVKAAALGVDAFKIKVGHPDVARDVHRLDLLRNAVGPDAIVMVDANESWTVKQTLSRVATFRDAGHELYWVEDPIIRSDPHGMKLLSSALGGILLNCSDYLTADGKAALAFERAVDTVNLHGHISEALRVAAAFAAQGLPVSIGNTSMNLGANIAAALPEAQFTEHSFLTDNDILECPYPVERGKLILPETPGHGLNIKEEYRAALVEAPLSS